MVLPQKPSALGRGSRTLSRRIHTMQVCSPLSTSMEIQPGICAAEDTGPFVIQLIPLAESNAAPGPGFKARFGLKECLKIKARIVGSPPWNAKLTVPFDSTSSKAA
jgi:hypothetical protein